MLEALANVGEFIGALGVIVSIGHVAIQIRQNTQAVRSTSDHRAAEQTWSAHALGMEIEASPRA